MSLLWVNRNISPRSNLLNQKGWQSRAKPDVFTQILVEVSPSHDMTPLSHQGPGSWEICITKIRVLVRSTVTWSSKRFTKRSWRRMAYKQKSRESVGVTSLQNIGGLNNGKFTISTPPAFCPSILWREMILEPIFAVPKWHYPRKLQPYPWVSWFLDIFGF